MTCERVRLPGVWTLHKPALVSNPHLRYREAELQQHMALSSFCVLQRARILDRLALLEDRLKRNDLQGEERAGRLRRYLEHWNRVDRRVH